MLVRLQILLMEYSERSVIGALHDDNARLTTHVSFQSGPNKASYMWPLYVTKHWRYMHGGCYMPFNIDREQSSLELNIFFFLPSLFIFPPSSSTIQQLQVLIYLCNISTFSHVPYSGSSYLVCLHYTDDKKHTDLKCHCALVHFKHQSLTSRLCNPLVQWDMWCGRNKD